MHRVSSGFALPSVTIRVSGKLFRDHLEYLDRLVQTAGDCELWVVLDLAQLADIDRDALFFLMNGESHDFDILSCPNFIREWMSHESQHLVA